MPTKDILKAAVFTPTRRGWGLPIAFHASPGMAKTAQIAEFAAEAQLDLEILSPGERGEGAFGVVPVPQTFKGKKSEDAHTLLTYPAPDWSEKFFKSGRGIVFVDELTTAPPALQPPLLGLFLEGRVGGTLLPPGVRFIAAYNAAEEAAGGYELPPPVANRMGHIAFDPGTLDNWGSWLISAGTSDDVVQTKIDPSAEEERVLKIWPDHFAEAKGKVLGYLKSQPQRLHQMPPITDPAASRGWPSHRTWEYATRALAASTVHNLSENDTMILVASFIGEKVAAEFHSFLRNSDLPAAADLLDKKVKFKHNAKRIDKTYSVLTACAALVVPTNATKREKRVTALWEIIDDLLTNQKAAKDIVVSCVRMMVDAGTLAASNPTSMRILRDLAPILNAAQVQSRR